MAMMRILTPMTDNPMSELLKKRRQELQINSEAFRRAMHEDIDALKDSATGKGGKTVAIGAAVVVGFWSLRKFLRKRKKRRSRKERDQLYLGRASQPQPMYPAVIPTKRKRSPLKLLMGGMIGKSIAAFAIALAKQKIIEYLAGLQQTRQTNGTVHNLQLNPAKEEKRV